MPGFQRFHNSEGYYKTLYHELIHSTGHKSRLNRDLSNYFGTLNYGKEELIAELGTAFLCAESGISDSTIDNSAAYLDNWLSLFRKDKRILISAASQANKASSYILGKTEKATEEAA